MNLKKKKFLLAFVALILLCSTVQAVVLEDFESVADWTVLASGGGSNIIQNGVARSGNALQMETDGSNDNAFLDIRRNFDGSYFSVWARFSGNTTDKVLYFYDGDSANSILLWDITDKGMTDGGGQDTISATSTNTWYRLEIERLDSDHLNWIIYDETGSIIDANYNVTTISSWNNGTGVRAVIKDEAASQESLFLDELEEIPFTIELVSPVNGNTYVTTDINTVFTISGDCASYDVNVTNHATGQDDNVFFSGGLDDGEQLAVVYNYFPQNGQQTLSFDAYCAAENYNTSYDVNFSLALYDFNVGVSGFGSYGGQNFVNSLAYDINYFCGAKTGNVDLNLDANASTMAAIALNCDATVRNINATYSHGFETDLNLEFWLDAAVSVDNNRVFDANFTVDLNAPRILAFDVNNSVGFFSADESSTWLLCDDTKSPRLRYYITQNDVNVLDVQDDQNSLKSVDIDWNNGANDFNYSCFDLAGNIAFDLNELTIYSKHFVLVDEDDRNAFDTGNTTSLIAFGLDTNAFYDFLAEGTDKVYYFTHTPEAIRFEFTYDNAGSELQVNREFDVRVLDDVNINVCAAKLQAFYQQVFLSTTTREVIAVNDFADCYLTASYTSYAYSNVFNFSTYTVDKPYYLYTYISDSKVLLALLDGSRATEINLDMLVYEAQELDLTVVEDGLVISPYDVNTALIFYGNAGDELDSVVLKIYDGGTEVWSYTETENPGNLTVYFNHSTMDINAELLSLELTKYYADGSTAVIRRYFTLQGATGLLHPSFAVVIAFVVLVMGLTFVSRGIAFGWFGLIACGVSLAILAFAVPAWYVRFAQAIVVLITVFIALGFRAETSKVL